MKQTIRLTESQLSEMIQQSINEALEDESLWGGLSSIGSKMKNATSKMAKNAGIHEQKLGSGGPKLRRARIYCGPKLLRTRICCVAENAGMFEQTRGTRPDNDGNRGGKEPFFAFI